MPRLWWGCAFGGACSYMDNVSFRMWLVVVHNRRCVMVSSVLAWVAYTRGLLAKYCSMCTCMGRVVGHSIGHKQHAGMAMQAWGRLAGHCRVLGIRVGREGAFDWQ